MKNCKTKYALVTSFVSLFLCVTVLMGTTYAWFTDSVTSANNTIIAGNLDVELDYWKGNDWKDVQGQSDLFDPNAKWEPGHTEVVYLRVSNVGSLAFKYLFSINVAEEKIGMTAAGEKIQLSKYIQYGIVTENVTAGMFDGNRAGAIAAVATPRPISELISNNHNYGNFDGQVLPGEGTEQYVALVVWMPTDVGNEANHNGTEVPYIKLGVNLTATQYTHEVDSFDKYYDDGAIYPVNGKATVTIEPSSNIVGYNVQVRNNTNTAKIGALELPAAALKEGTTTFDVVYEEDAPDSNIVISDGYESVSYNISVSNLKDNNDVPVKVLIRIPADIDPATVQAYHYDDPIDFNYNPSDGYVSFETTGFSPFTVVFDAESVYTAPGTNPPDLPAANVTPYTVTETIEWGKYGQWSPAAGLEANLDAAYTFACIDDSTTVNDSPYKDWYCDFYVSLDRNLGENEIFLGGNYGSFGWVGFHNGDLTLDAGTEIPLLGSVTTNPWTYQDVVDYVGTFICGVGNVDDSLIGATFTVHLRLTNNNDKTEFYNVATIKYTFK